MEYVIWFALGAVVGGLIVFVVTYLGGRSRQKQMDTIVAQMKEAFAALSQEALTRNSDELIKRAGETLSRQSQAGGLELESKKKLIDQTLESIKSDLLKVERAVTEFDKERAERFAQLSTEVKNSAEQTDKLRQTAGKLEATLASTKMRGQWGERMAEDVLRLVGFVEGINYQKQKKMANGAIPDFTFLLPQDLVLNMDVKFPLGKYMEYVEAQTDIEKESLKSQFLSNARQRIKEVAGRDYIDPQAKTLDYAIAFIPNEQVYCFIHENDRTILDDALRDRVVPCSPVTLYAVLAVIRQATETFKLEKTAKEIQSLLKEFRKQWDMFKELMDKMGRKIDEAHKEFESLATTRSKALERPLTKIEALEMPDNVPAAAPPEGLVATEMASENLAGPDSHQS